MIHPIYGKDPPPPLKTLNKKRNEITKEILHWRIQGGRGSHQNADCVQFSGAGANEVMEGFEMNGFPRVIGDVDGCQIQIKTPQNLYDVLPQYEEELLCNLAGLSQKDKQKQVIKN